MESTLEKLLSIRGAHQLSMVSPSEMPQKGPQELADAEKDISPCLSPKGLGNPLASSEMGMSESASPSALVMEAWREAFRICRDYAPRIREAGETGGDAWEIWEAIYQRVGSLAQAGEEAEAVAAGVCEILTYTWESARKSQKAPCADIRVERMRTDIERLEGELARLKGELRVAGAISQIDEVAT